MSSAAPEVGRRLRAARDHAGLSQAQVAAALEVTQTAVSYWEAGRRLPGLDQLMSLAALLNLPVSELLPDTSTRRPVAATLRAVADQVDSAELARALEAFTDVAQHQPAPPAELSVSVAGPRDAAEHLLAAVRWRSGPVDVEELARRCGARVIDFDFDSMVDGLVVTLDDGPAMGLDTNTIPTRRRFTLAHELGHFVLRHAGSFHVDFRTEGEPPGYNWRHERAANDFAANLLMPAGAVRSAHAKGVSVRAIAKQFDVSVMATSARLSSLGLRQGPLEG
jgi:transcriptional regulator with XRE-family HTH domain